MSCNGGVEPVFRALDDNIYKTEEKALDASVARSIRNGMLSRLGIESGTRSSSAIKSDKCEALEWFISDMDNILVAYYASRQAAQELLCAE